MFCAGRYLKSGAMWRRRCGPGTSPRMLAAGIPACGELRMLAGCLDLARSRPFLPRWEALTEKLPAAHCVQVHDRCLDKVR